MKSLRRAVGKATLAVQPRSFLNYEEKDPSFCGQFLFQQLLKIERRRTERSQRPFLLLLIDLSQLDFNLDKDLLPAVKESLRTSLRETDIRGWYDQNRIIGVICTEMSSIDDSSLAGIKRNIHSGLGRKLSEVSINRIGFTFQIFPENKEEISENLQFNRNFYPEYMNQQPSFRFSVLIKNMIDTTGSFAALLLCAPLLLLAAAAIKLTSRGPVFFQQERLGVNGKPFKMLKFRSMYTNCDAAAHQEYIKKYITDQNNAAVEPGVFKLNNDTRITPVGKFLRKTSIDELPQLLNVLKGDMSLVGPRPPIAYEFELYAAWHMRRLLACKPGITGLWQVSGRSRTTFDEMVRLDLRYINSWSLWLDLKILFRTPLAVFNGNGAY